MQFISNFCAIFSQFLCNVFPISLQFLFQLLCNLPTISMQFISEKICTHFESQLWWDTEESKSRCSLTLSLCCAILVLLSFNSVHTDCCTSKAFSTKYQKRKRKREIQLFFYGNYLGI